MYTLRNVGNALNRKPSAFATENLLTRKLYSVDIKEDEFYTTKKFKDSKVNHDGLFYDELNNRVSFYYNYKECCGRCVGKSPCCCSCLRFGCRYKDSVQDRIFDKAVNRLSYEFDLINIIHSMRVSSFLAQIKLKQYQIDMVRYFSHYKIEDKRTLFDKVA